MASRERRREGLVVAQPLRERDRLAGEPQRGLGVTGEVQDLGEPGHQSRPQLALLRPHAVERLPQELDQLGVDHARLVVAAAVADGRPCELLGRAPPRERRGRREHGPRGRVAGAGERLAEREQQLGPVRRVGRLAQPLGVERALQLARLVLPCERLRRPVGRLPGVADRGLDAAEMARLEEVVGQLGHVGAQLGAVRLERLGDAAVQPHAPCVAQARVQRLADQRVREGQPVGVVGRREQPRGDGAVEHVDDGAPRRLGRVLEQRGPERLAGDRREREDLPRLLAEPRHAPHDDLAHALRDHQLVERPPRIARLGEHAQHLPQEQRVAARQVAQAPGGAAVEVRQLSPSRRGRGPRARRRRATARAGGRRSRRPAVRRAGPRRRGRCPRTAAARASRRARGAGGAGASAGRPTAGRRRPGRACRGGRAARAPPPRPRRAGSARRPAARSAARARPAASGAPPARAGRAPRARAAARPPAPRPARA